MECTVASSWGRLGNNVAPWEMLRVRDARCGPNAHELAARVDERAARLSGAPPSIRLHCLTSTPRLSFPWGCFQFVSLFSMLSQLQP